MELYDAIDKRRSVRKFLDLPVEWDKLSKILDAGRKAPSAGNLQSVRFIVTVSKSKIKKIADACMQQLWIETAPCVVVVLSDIKNLKTHYGERGEKLYAMQDAAAAAENVFLSAQDEELATAWIGAFNEEMIDRIFEISPNYKPIIVLPIGYADEKPPIPKQYDLRDIIFFESWGNKIRHPSLWPLGQHIGKIKGALKTFTQKAISKTKKK